MQNRKLLIKEKQALKTKLQSISFSFFLKVSIKQIKIQLIYRSKWNKNKKNPTMLFFLATLAGDPHPHPTLVRNTQSLCNIPECSCVIVAVCGWRGQQASAREDVLSRKTPQIVSVCVGLCSFHTGRTRSRMSDHCG